MNILDIIVLVCLAIALIHGLSKGFISQAVALVSLVLGVWLSYKFSNLVSGWLEPYLCVSKTVLQVIAFALILIAVVIGLNLLGKALTGLVKLVMLGWLDRILGIVFALFKAALAIGLVFILMDTLYSALQASRPKFIADSVLYPSIKNLADAVFPYLKIMIFNK